MFKFLHRLRHFFRLARFHFVADHVSMRLICIECGEAAFEIGYDGKSLKKKLHK